MKKLYFLPLIVAVVTGMLLMAACGKCVDCELGELVILEKPYNHPYANYEIKALFLQQGNYCPCDTFYNTTIIKHITGNIPNRLKHRTDTILVKIDLHEIWSENRIVICDEVGGKVYKIKKITEKW